METEGGPTAESVSRVPPVRRIPATVFFVAAFAVVLLWLLFRGGGPGGQAPEISAAQWYNVPGGETTSLAALRGKVVVVEFWATTCRPCRKSIPRLNELHARYAPRGVVIIGLSSEPPGTVGPFGQRRGMRSRVGAGSSSGRDYGVSGIPHAFVVGTAGKVTWKGHPMDPELATAIEKALAGAE